MELWWRLLPDAVATRTLVEGSRCTPHNDLDLGGPRRRQAGRGDRREEDDGGARTHEGRRREDLPSRLVRRAVMGRTR